MPNRKRGLISRATSREARHEHRAQRADNRHALIQQTTFPQPTIQPVSKPAVQHNTPAQPSQASEAARLANQQLVAQQQAAHQAAQLAAVELATLRAAAEQAAAQSAAQQAETERARLVAEEKAQQAERQLKAFTDLVQQEKLEAKAQHIRIQKRKVECTRIGRQLAMPAIKKFLEGLNIDWSSIPDQKLEPALPKINFSTLSPTEKNTVVSGATEQSQKIILFLLKAGCISAAIKLSEKITWIVDNKLSIIDSALLTDGVQDLSLLSKHHVPDEGRRNPLDSKMAAASIEVWDDNSLNTDDKDNDEGRDWVMVSGADENPTGLTSTVNAPIAELPKKHTASVAISTFFHSASSTQPSGEDSASQAQISVLKL